jgi:1,2-diacylglycerol 3-alpha-glucosyltransferase
MYSATNTNVIPEIETIKDTMIYNMCLAFRQMGHNITLVAASEYHPVKEEEYDFPVLFFPSSMKNIFLPAVLPFQPELWQYLKKNSDGFDLILTSETFAFPTLFAAMLKPSKTVIWQEVTTLQKKFLGIPSFLWYNIFARLIMRRVKCVIPFSPQAKKFLSGYFKNVTEVVNHGINIDKFRVSETKKRQFICVAQLIPRKNVEGIILKFSRLTAIDGYSDFKLYIAGRGEMRTQLEQQAKDLGIADRVIFTGFLSHDELSGYVRDSCALLVNTRQDLNMHSIRESIASGTPVVTNLVPTSAAYIRDNQLGIAKIEWDECDLKTIIDNNAYFTQNCVEYRGKLSNKYAAEKLLYYSKQ